MLQHALKEWAAVCQALASGRQAVILRKGGIAETEGRFEVEQKRFWLFPTYTHQQMEHLDPDAASFLHAADADKPLPGFVRLSHFAEVDGVYHVHNLAGALSIAGLHIWSEETVRQRFHYRRPGLFVLPLRVYRAPACFEIPNTADYDGCKSWVRLEKELSTAGATPVLTDAAFKEVSRTLDRLLNPTAFV